MASTAHVGHGNRVSRPRKPGLWFGLRCFLSGLFGLLLKPSLWPLALVPTALFLVVWLATGWALASYVSSSIQAWLGGSYSTLGAVAVWLLKLLAGALSVFVTGFIAMPVSQTLSGPALEALVRSEERRLGAPQRPKTSMLRDMLNALSSLLLGTALAAPPIAILAAIAFVFPPSVVVIAPLQFMLAAFVITWDVCDLPLSLRGLSARERLRWLASHKGAVLGFGIGLAACNLVPGLLFLVLPAAVLGATQLTWAIEQCIPSKVPQEAS